MLVLGWLLVLVLILGLVFLRFPKQEARWPTVWSRGGFARVFAFTFFGSHLNRNTIYFVLSSVQYIVDIRGWSSKLVGVTLAVDKDSVRRPNHDAKFGESSVALRLLKANL